MYLIEIKSEFLVAGCFCLIYYATTSTPLIIVVDIGNNKTSMVCDNNYASNRLINSVEYITGNILNIY